MTKKQATILALLEQGLTPQDIVATTGVSHKYVCVVRKWMNSDRSMPMTMVGKVKPIYPPRQCSHRHCGKTFVPTGGYDKIYCSFECQRAEARLREEDKRREKGMAKRKYPTTPAKETVRRDTYKGFFKYMKQYKHEFQTRFNMAHTDGNIRKVAEGLGLN
jgi:hypothetical protein